MENMGKPNLPQPTHLRFPLQITQLLQNFVNLLLIFAPIDFLWKMTHYRLLRIFLVSTGLTPTFNSP